MHACVRMDDVECLDKFDMGQGVRQGCVLAPLMFNMVFTAVLRVADKRFLSDAVITNNMVQLQRKKEKGEKKGTPRTGKVDERGGVGWGGGAEIVGYAVRGRCGHCIAMNIEGLERMMTVIVTACSAFGLTVSEAKTEIMCPQTKDGKVVSFAINAAG